MTKTNYHIHLVEDSKVDVIVNTKLLKLMDDSFQISDYPSGESFCSAIGNGLFSPEKKNVVLLDIQLPGINGFECITRLREKHPEDLAALKVYMLSSSIDRNDIKRANEDPDILHVLEKPLDVQVLRQLLKL